MYKPDFFETCAYSISLFTSIMLREVSKMITPNSDWQQRFMESIESLLQFIEDVNVEFKRDIGK